MVCRERLAGLTETDELRQENIGYPHTKIADQTYVDLHVLITFYNALNANRKHKHVGTLPQACHLHQSLPASTMCA